jgi:hypothetical protein
MSAAWKGFVAVCGWLSCAVVDVMSQLGLTGVELHSVAVQGFQARLVVPPLVVSLASMSSFHCDCCSPDTWLAR